MAHSDQNQQLEFVFTKPPDKEEKQPSNAFVVSYVDFEGKVVTRFYDRYLDNKKK